MKKLKMKSSIIDKYSKQIKDAHIVRNKSRVNDMVKAEIDGMYNSEKVYRDHINNLCTMVSDYKNSLTAEQRRAKQIFINKLDAYMEPLNKINNLPRCGEVNPNNNMESFSRFIQYTSNPDSYKAIQDLTIDQAMGRYSSLIKADYKDEFESLIKFHNETHPDSKPADLSVFDQIYMQPIQRLGKYKIFYNDVKNKSNMGSNFVNMATNAATDVDVHTKKSLNIINHAEFREVTDAVVKNLKMIERKLTSTEQKNSVKSICDNIDYINLIHSDPVDKFNSLEKALNELRVTMPEPNKSFFQRNNSSPALKALNEIDHVISVSKSYTNLLGKTKMIRENQKNDLTKKRNGESDVLDLSNLDRVYADPVKLEYLRELTQAFYISENTDFYGRYLQVKNNLTVDNVQDLYDRFIKYKADKQINIDDATRKSLAAIIKNGLTSEDFLMHQNDIVSGLDQAAKEVATILKNDVSLRVGFNNKQTNTEWLAVSKKAIKKT